MVNRQGLKNSKNLTIYISNLSEDVWPFIQSISDPYKRQAEIIENALLSEHDLFSFSGVDNAVMILPKAISEFYLNYFLQISNNKNFYLMSPKLHTGEICKDIISDKGLWDELVNLATEYENVSLASYTNSWQFFKLAEKLSQGKVNVSLNESPKEADSWVVDFFGSKSGIRQLAQQSVVKEPDFRMPPGLISIDIENTAKMAAKMYIKNKALVLKTNKGHAGAGLFIFREKDLPYDYQDCVRDILKKFKSEKYWSKFPIIVEKYIDPAMSIGGGFPNIEFKISKQGKVEFLYYCALRVTREGIFKGVEINNSVMTDQDTAQIMDTGFFLGEELAQRGYRGYYELDYVVSKNGDIYVTESNVRRTGGTHVYYLAKFLFGKDFMYETFILTNNLYPVRRQKRTLTGKKLLQVLAPILYDKSKKEGLIVSGMKLLEQNQFGYVIFGKTKARAVKLEEKMERLLSGLGS